jgi:hypothetical protein
MKRRLVCSPTALTSRSAFAGYRFPPEVILLAVRWTCCFLGADDEIRTRDPHLSKKWS